MRDAQSLSLGREIAGTLGGYLAGQIKISAILAVLYSIGYAIAGVPVWYVLGPLSGLLNFVPFVGSVLALMLTAFVALWGDSTMRNYIGILVTFVVVQGIEGFYLTPKILGRRVGLSPLMVFLAILIGGFAFPPFGVFLAVPAVAIVAILWRRSQRVSDQARMQSRASL